MCILIYLYKYLLYVYIYSSCIIFTLRTCIFRVHYVHIHGRWDECMLVWDHTGSHWACRSSLLRCRPCHTGLQDNVIIIIKLGRTPVPPTPLPVGVQWTFYQIYLAPISYVVESLSASLCKVTYQIFFVHYTHHHRLLSFIVLK